MATPDEEVLRGDIARAWAGGMRGRAVIDKILPEVLLTSVPICAFYLQRLGFFAKPSIWVEGSFLLCFELWQVADLLSSEGSFFLVTVAENDPKGASWFLKPQIPLIKSLRRICA